MNVQQLTVDMNQMYGMKTSKTQLSKTQTNDDFASTLEKSKEKQQVAKKPNTNQDKTSTVEKDKPIDAKKPSTETESTTEVADLDGVNDPKEAVLSKEETEKQLLQEVADLLGITPEQLENILATLQLGITDLLDPNNMQQFLLEVHGTEDPMDLLLIPDITSKMTEIGALVEEYVASPMFQEDNALGKVALETLELTPALEEEQIIIQPEVAKETITHAKTKGADSQLETAPKEERPNVITSENNVTAQDNQDLSQSEEQFTPDAQARSNEFLDNLTHSVGEALHWQNEQIADVTRTMVSEEIVHPRQVLDQIVERIKVSTIENETLMNIQLKPEHLGKLNMEVVSKQGTMTALFTVENDKTKTIIEQNIEQLRQVLEDKGLIIEELEVTVGQNQTEQHQTFASAKPRKNISEMINKIMNDNSIEDTVEEKTIANDGASEVDFIA